MPILEVEIVTRPGEELSPSLAASLADEVAAIFGSPPGGTWVRLRRLSQSDYAENSGGPPEGISPVFVTVLQAHPPSIPDRSSEAERLAAAIATVCNRPTANVHVLYLPPAVGRMAFGGNLILEE